MTNPARFLSLLVGVLALCGPGCPRPDGPAGGPTSGPQPPAWDDKARDLFEAKGIAVPATEMTARVENAGELDLARIREAIAEAHEVSPEEMARLESAQREGAPAASETARTGAAPEERPSPVLAPPAAPPPPAREAEARPEPVVAAKVAMDAEASRDQAAAPGGGGEEKQKKKPQDTQEPGRTVLQPIAGAPREPKILVRDEEGKLKPLALREMRLVAYLQGPRARTAVDVVFENRSDRRIEGTFYFPLPADASPVGFAMFSGAPPLDAERAFPGGRALPSLGQDSAAFENLETLSPARAGDGPDWQQRQVARVVAQKRAREVYEEVVRRSVDPALLEWSGGNTFQARVFPIEARSLKRLVLVYEQTLPFDGEFLRYTFPLPEKKQPRPITARVHHDDSLGTVRAVAMGKDARLAVPRGKAMGPWTAFDLVQEDEGGALSVAVAPKDRAAQAITGADPGGLPGRAFFVRLLPSIPEGKLQKTGRALFVIDSSLSAEDGKAYELQSRTLEALLEKDDSIAQYAVVLFDVRPRWLHAPRYRDNTPQNRAETMRELRKVYLEGATNFEALLSDLDANLSWLRAGEGAAPTAFLLSDGQITWGQTEVQAMARRHPSASALRWMCYRFGESAVNQALFDELSRASAGRTVTVLAESEIPAAAAAHRRPAAVLEGVEVLGGAAADLTLAGAPKLIFPGQELRLAGRLLEGRGARVVVRASLGGQPLRFEAAIPDDSDHRLAARAFGEAHVARLLALDDERLDRMIVALSQHYLLANARASLLILEDERAFEAFGLKEEQVDLANLERLRAQEEDQRLERLQGLDLDQASDLARAVVRGLAAAGDKIAPPLRPQPLLDRPLAGGEERVQAELRYREERKTERMDVMIYDAVARVRALAGDTMGAVRALSCTVELRPQDTEALRLVGYGLLALGQYPPAAELFERARLLRPFEGQVYLEEALALDGCGRWADAARRYEIVLSRAWPRHDNEVKTVASFHYARLLNAAAQSKDLPMEFAANARRRLEELAALTGTGTIDYQLTTHWSTDGIDIDLWVIEPDGTKCYYGNRETPLGGKLWWDITDGLGPELYHMRKASRGRYLVLVHYYGNNSPRLAVPTALLLVADRQVFGPEDRYARRMQMRMLPKRDAVLELRREEL